MMDTLRSITLTKAHWNHMRNHVNRELPLEACGMIGGIDDKILEVFDTINILQSPTRFQIDPKKQLEVIHTLEGRGWDFLGVFHSHPNGPTTPSRADIQEAFYPNIVNLIWSQQEAIWDCQAFVINYGKIHPVELLIDPSD